MSLEAIPLNIVRLRAALASLTSDFAQRLGTLNLQQARRAKPVMAAGGGAISNGGGGAGASGGGGAGSGSEAEGGWQVARESWGDEGEEAAVEEKPKRARRAA
jgi:hypothetical protein